MTWIKLDDTLPNNPKILPLSDKAFRLYIEGLCYANQYLTDGFLNSVIVARLNGEETKTELIEAGLWDEVQNGVQIHDYCKHQTPKSEVQKKREQGRNRAQTHKERVTNASLTLPETEYRNRIQKEKTSSFDEFWESFPRKAGKQDAQKSFERALKSATLEEILIGAKKYAQDPNREAEFTAHPSTWLNQGRWSDDPMPVRGSRITSKPLLPNAPVIPPFTESDRPIRKPLPDFLKSGLP